MHRFSIIFQTEILQSQLLIAAADPQIGKRSGIVELNGNIVVLNGFVVTSEFLQHLPFFKVGPYKMVVADDGKIESRQCFFIFFQIEELLSKLVPANL